MCFELSDIVNHVVEFRSVWELFYSTETRNLHGGREDHDIPRDGSSCPFLDDRCIWELCIQKLLSMVQRVEEKS